MAMLCLHKTGFNISRGFALAAGLAGLFVAIALAVGIFISIGMRMQKYSYIGKEPFSYDEGVETMIRERLTGFRAELPVNISVAVGLCICSPVPVCAFAIMGKSNGAALLGVAILLVMLGCGVFMFVRDGMIMDGFTRLLQQGDYTVAKKRRRRFFNHLGDNITNAIADKLDKLS